MKRARSTVKANTAKKKVSKPQGALGLVKGNIRPNTASLKGREAGTSTRSASGKQVGSKARRAKGAAPKNGIMSGMAKGRAKPKQKVGRGAAAKRKTAARRAR